jgi:hypothetical protein
MVRRIFRNTVTCRNLKEGKNYENNKQVKVHPITGPEGPRGGVEVSLGTRRGWGG